MGKLRFRTGRHRIRMSPRTRAALATVAFAAATIASRTAPLFLRGQTAPADSFLPICERNDTLFPTEPDDEDDERNPVERWRDLYHTNVATVVEEHVRPDAEQLVCVDDPHVSAGDALTELAEELEPWSDGETPFDERDLPAILLEYLRAYQCALNARQANLVYEVTVDAADFNDRSFTYDSHEDDGEMTLSPIVWESEKQMILIRDELRSAEPVLRRTLKYIAGRSRLDPLAVSFECLERASLEVRNVLSMVADTAACLPRIWDVRNPVRDLPAT